MSERITDSPDEFERLRRFTLFHQGQFSLGLARINEPRQRNEVISRLKEALETEGIRAIHIDISNRHPESLRQALQSSPEGRALLHKPQHATLVITGMEHLVETSIESGGRPPFAAALNAERDILRSILPIPVVLFMTDIAMDRLDISAPDFFDWYSASFHFQSTGLAAARAESTSCGLHRQEPIAATQPGKKNIENMESLRKELELDPTKRPELATLLYEIGRSYASLPDFPDRQLAVSYLTQSARIAHELKDNAQEADSLAKLADVYYWIDNYEQSAENFQHAIRHYTAIQDLAKVADCQQRLGDVYIQLSEMTLAEQQYQQALTRYQEKRQKTGAAACIRSLGDVARLKGDFTEAEHLYRAALPLYRELKDPLGEANCVQSIGDMLLHEGQYRQAQIRYSESLKIYQEIANQLGKANCLQGLGHVARLQGDLSTARLQYHEALKVYQDIGYRLGEASCIESLGDLARRREDYEDSEKNYLESLSIYRSLRNKLGEANTYYGLGEMFFQRGEYATASPFFQRAQGIYRKAEARLGEANTLAAQGAIALLNDQNESAWQALQRAYAIYMEIGDRYSIAAQTGNYGWLLYEKGKYEEARPYLLRAAEYFTALGLLDQAERHQRAGERE